MPSICRCPDFCPERPPHKDQLCREKFKAKDLDVVRRRKQGETVRSIAASMKVAPATVRKTLQAAGQM